MENEVYFNQNSLIRVDNKIISDLKERARNNSTGKYRLCMQHSPQDDLHEMFIVRSIGDYGRPDKHLHTTESHTIIDGAMLVILFEDNGEIRDVFELSKECYHTYRIDAGIYHMQIPLTEQVVYYEVKLGPFTEKSNIYPDWSPEPKAEKEIIDFMENLKKKLRDYKQKEENRE